MPKDTKLYDILQVNPTSTETEIILAYYHLAEKFHPHNLKQIDENSEEKYNQIRFAYDILSNETKRKLYDAEGIEAVKDQKHVDDDYKFDHFNNEDFVYYETKKYTKNLVFPLKVTLEDLYNGASKNFDYEISVICNSCQGSGKNTHDVKKCSKCDGKNVFDQNDKQNRIQEICPECNGEGEIFEENNKCEICQGKKTVKQEKKIQIKIDKGMNDRQKITYSGYSDQEPGHETGDVIFIIEQEPHELFTRKSDYLFLNHKINITEALCGFKYLFKHLDGRYLLINHPAGECLSDKTIKCVKNQGMPFYLNESKKGDLMIKFNVIFPESNSLSLETIKELEAILPEKKKFEFSDNDKLIEVSMEVADKNLFETESDDSNDYILNENLPQESSFHVNKESFEDDYTNFGSNQRIECNNQ